ncbi:hypothetical protein ABZV77_11420 [Streptomyces sp. NPDC004732]|uniref:hypothetical protein n=1 Tax=Streptomyces sp. NPDC004732 TaxID=3154290 RepID=UPI0033AEFD04
MSFTEIQADEWDKLFAVAEKAGRMVSHKFPGVEADDITQDVMERFVECESAARKLLNSWNESNDNTAFKAILIMANQVGSKELNDRRLHSGEFTYTSDYVRKLLSRGMLSDRACGKNDKGENIFEAQLNSLMTGKKSKKDFSERVNVDDRIDLNLGFAKLTGTNQNVIIKRYVLEERLGDDERKQLSRAVSSLALHMNSHSAKHNTDHDGPGSRKALSNGAAYWLTSNQYSPGGSK